jgi:uncharacterized delta-60 repeat protein
LLLTFIEVFMHRLTFSESILVAAFALPLCCGIVRAAAGDADPSFGGAGYVRYAAPKTIPGLFAAAVGLDDGSAIVVGGADTDVFVRHYRVDGSLDIRFGNGGTTFVPGLNGGGFSTPALHLFRQKSGRLLIEQSGIVRRLNADGSYDSTYLPAGMNVEGSGLSVTSYSLLPLDDGRFVVVTTPQAGFNTSNISVRFYLPDGRPDTVRGDANGERILSPPDSSAVYRPTSAATDAQGKILIASRVEHSGTADTGLVVIRLNPDGGYDTTFGTGGVFVIGAQLGIVNDAKIIAGADGRIGFLFSVPETTRSVSYLVVYILTANGQQDSSVPSGGRISLIVPPETKLDERSLQWVSGSPVMTVAGYTRPDILGNGNPEPALQIAQWRIDLSDRVVGGLELTNAGLDSTFLPKGFALAGGGIFWTYGSEDNFFYGALHAPTTGSGRGVLLPFDARSLTTSTPPRIAFSLDGHYFESFKNAKVLSDGGIVVLGTYVSRGVEAYALTRFTADGRLDLDYGDGNGRRQLSSATRLSWSFLLRSSDDMTTVLTQFDCSSVIVGTYALLRRFDARGMPDTRFGDDGVVALSGRFASTSPGFVDANGAVTLIKDVQPVRYTASGMVDSSFSGTAWPVQPVGGAFFLSPILLDELPDGRLQGIRLAAGNTMQVFRWLSNGSIDDSLPPLVISLPAGGPSGSDIKGMLILPDGRTLIAIDQTNQRVLLRLRADGALDVTFGNGGVALADGLGIFGIPTKLAVQSDGKILFTYTTRLGNGLAMAVARFTSDGQRDTTFTSDGRFDSIFSLSGYETASDLIALSDGSLLAVGQSGLGPQYPGSGSVGFGLLLKLRGTASSPAQASAAVIEFFNTRLVHYFVSGGPGEIVSVDTGGAGPGWQRTGLGFSAYVPETGIPSGAVPVCRFYGTPGRGPNSHFYTVSASECAAVKQDPGWTYEGTAFYLFAPINGQCANGQQPVYRVYNNRFAQNDSNHRYTTESNVYAQMQALGWIPEGVVFCGPPQ